MTNRLTSGRARTLLWGTAVAALAMPSLAYAQPAQPAPAPEQPSATEATSADEDEDAIVITAQRRAERLEDVPMTVGVASSETLEAAGATSLRDITRVVSGVSLNQGGAFPQPTIRGVTTLINGTSFENNVAVYVDGFYEPAPQALGIDLPNISNVQVLKGPQGTLYGRNATGGAILINTITPGDEWQGKAELTYGRFNDWRIGGYFAGPLTEGVGISIAAYTRESDGYMKLGSRTVPGETDGDAAPISQDAIRAKLKFDLIDNFSATLGYNYVHTSNAVGNMFTPFENVPAFPYAALPAGATKPTRLGVAAWDHDARVETFQHQGTLTMELDTGIGDLKSYTGYQTLKPITSFDFDGSYVNLLWSTSQFRQKTFQQAVDFTTSAIDDVDLIVGGLYFRDKLKTVGPHIANFVGTNAFTWPGTTPPDSTMLFQSEDRRFTQDKKAWAVYFDATFHAGDAHFTFGGRYSQESQEVFAQSTCFRLPPLSPCTGLAALPGGGFLAFPATTKSSSYNKFTPRASFRYEIGPRTNVYASWSQGFRSGAWNASIPLLPTGGPDRWIDADQEEVDAFEIGFKTARRGFRFEASAFYYMYRDLQVSVTQCVGTPVCTIQTVIDNAPKASIKGVEASFEYSPIENLNLRGGATYLHARYGEGFLLSAVGVDCTPNPVGQPAGGIGINANSDLLKRCLNVNQVQDLSGLQMSRAPKLAANLGISYEIPMGDGGVLIAGNANYTSSYVVTNPSVWGNDPSVPADRQREQRFRQSGFVLLSAQVTFTEPGGHAYLRLWGNNLTNRKYRLHYTGTSTFGSYSPMAEPRTYGASLGFKF